MKYIALLRGINIGRENRIKMADLRTIFESMGFKNVKTYLQSGNVIFDNKFIDNVKIAEDIERKVSRTFGFAVNAVIRTDNEFENIINNNPFINDSNIGLDKLHVTFLKEAFDKETILDLNLNKEENEKFEIKGSEIYLYLPNGYARTKLTNNTFERKLKIIATTRNWKTVNKLLELSKLE
ncbi:DUF1697 domain-containing protein [Methanobacterium oryzae]|uniref:DUF1697 domain-containing protein n=1 Tax=Methanobacterium oryzae TaxID=69540 RepID=UPI003D1CA262